MHLFRLVYHSRSSIEASHRPLAVEVADILALSVANNRAVGVTGGLIYDRSWFVQALEGEHNAVTETFERLATDPRHHHIVVVKSGVADDRRFPYWWMAGASWEGEQAGLSLTPEDGFDPRTLARDALLDLVEAMVHAQSERQGRQAWTTTNAMKTG
jgi:hypothetical protein